MMRLFKKALAVSILVVMSMCYFSVCCYAGSWISKEGQMYNKLALNYYNTVEDFNEDGDSEKFSLNSEYEEYNPPYCMEYGLTNLTVTTSLYCKYLKKEDDTIKSKTSKYIHYPLVN